jgi:hypothetical protein
VISCQKSSPASNRRRKKRESSDRLKQKFVRIIFADEEKEKCQGQMMKKRKSKCVLQLLNIIIDR